ncbi:MAG: hypothetical protein J6R46_00525 [Clostridia bacterium]|nr:hypothetical protein [Clostridia bacterium]
MTREKKYNAVLEALGEALAQKDNTICVLQFELDNVKKKLADAEAQLAATAEKEEEF